jgi:hypothetical protein
VDLAPRLRVLVWCRRVGGIHGRLIIRGIPKSTLSIRLSIILFRLASISIPTSGTDLVSLGWLVDIVVIAIVRRSVLRREEGLVLHLVVSTCFSRAHGVVQRARLFLVAAFEAS